MTIYERIKYYVEEQIENRFDEDNSAYGNNHNNVTITVDDIKMSNNKERNFLWKQLFEATLIEIACYLNGKYSKVTFNIKNKSIKVVK